mgnify:CR=1 FL=1
MYGVTNRNVIYVRMCCRRDDPYYGDPFRRPPPPDDPYYDRYRDDPYRFVSENFGESSVILFNVQMQQFQAPCFTSMLLSDTEGILMETPTGIPITGMSMMPPENPHPHQMWKLSSSTIN